MPRNSTTLNKRRGSCFSSMAQYVTQGVGELDQEKLGDLLQLKYHTVDDAAAQLGSVSVIRDTFVGFQQYLYAPQR